ncbi:MAG: ectoine synthase [Pseudomonadota bacterium]
MFVRTQQDLEALGRIKFPADKSFRSARFLTASDQMGFSYNENRVAADTVLDVWLKNHWEANYIVSGQGHVKDHSTQQQWDLKAGVLYVVGPNDRHRLTFPADECHISIFFPPLTGNERFDEDGSYEPSGPIERTERRMFVRHADKFEQLDQQHSTGIGQIQTSDLLTDTDRIGFNLADIRIAAGADVTFRCESRCEAYHILNGCSTVTDINTDKRWTLESGTNISVRPGAAFHMQAKTDLHLLKVTSHQQ